MDLENLYLFSLNFKEKFGGDNFKLLKQKYPKEVEEREKINNIINDINLSIGNKLEKILIIQNFSQNRKLFHIGYEDLIRFVSDLHNNLPTNEEINRINILTKLINLIKENLITKNGVLEKFPEFSYLSEKIDICPLKFNPIWKIFQMVESSDVNKYKLSIKKIRFNTFKKNVLNNHWTYLQFKEERKNFECLHTPNKYKEELDFLELNTKFRIDSYLFYRLKDMRQKNILNDPSPLEIIELYDLRANIAPIYWNRIPKLLWKGLKGEYKRISFLKESPIKKKRIKVYLSRYNHFYDRLNPLFIKN